MSSLLDKMMERDDGGGARAAPLVVIRLAAMPKIVTKDDGTTELIATKPLGKGDTDSRIVWPKKAGAKPFVTRYLPTETREYMARLRAAGIDAMRGRKVFGGPLEVLVFAYFPIPDSWSTRQKDDARAGIVRPTVKPDADNISKTLDALSPHRDKRTGARVPVVWSDDAIIVDWRVVKVYALKQPGLIIEIREAGPPPTPWVPPAA